MPNHYPSNEQIIQFHGAGSPCGTARKLRRRFLAKPRRNEHEDERNSDQLSSEKTSRVSNFAIHGGRLSPPPSLTSPPAGKTFLLPREKNNYSRIREHWPRERLLRAGRSRTRRIDADEAERPRTRTHCRRVCTFLIVAKIITL